MPAFDSLCNDILTFPNVRFVGAINNLGRQVSGRYKDGIVPLVDEEQYKMCLEHALELALTKDLDAPLGNVVNIVTRRQNVVMITVPLDSHILLISMNPESHTDDIVEKIMSLIHHA